MPNCNSCGAEVKESYKFCPACNAELPQVQPSNGNNLASDSVIMGDQFSGTKADTIIINQYAPNQPSEPQENHKPVTPHPSNNNCSRCKKDFLSEQLLNCIDTQCENSMCYSCYQLWQVPSIPEWQYCQEHTTKMKVEHEANCKKCSSCEVPLTYGRQLGSCEYDGCNNSMCMDCYNRWYVANPLVQYRSDTLNWNYCESHTKLSIEKAELELQHRFDLANQYCEKNWEQWVREKRASSLDKSLSDARERNYSKLGMATACVIIYLLDYWLAGDLSGAWYWIYNIGCFWIPMLFCVFIFVIFLETSTGIVPLKIAKQRERSIEIPHKEFNFGIGNDNGAMVDWDPIKNLITTGQTDDGTKWWYEPADYFYDRFKEEIQ